MDRLAQLKTMSGMPGGGGGGGGMNIGAYSPAEGHDSGDPESLEDGKQTQHSLDAASPVMVTFEEPPSEIDQEAAEALDAYVAQVDTTKGKLREMGQACDELKARHGENITTIDEARSARLRSEIEDLSQGVTDRAKAIKDTLDTMNKRIAELKETPESTQANSAVIRIQENQYNFLVSRLTQQMGEYQRQQAANEALYKAQTQRQIKIKYTNTDGSAIDDATAAQLAEQVMDNNLNSYVFQQSKDVLASIIETRNDIYRIEQSMRDLNQLFNDLAFLVHEQGEMMDIILSNVQAANNYVEKGRKELKKARKYQKKSRKKMICLICCAVTIVVLIVVIGVVAGTIKV